MDDVDDVEMDTSGEDRVASLSTDQLREEVARLQSLLVAPLDEDDDDDDDEELQNLALQPHDAAFSWVEDTTLKYTNGDVYKVRAKQNVGYGRGRLASCDTTAHNTPSVWKSGSQIVLSLCLQRQGEAIENVRNGTGTHQCSNGDFYGETTRSSPALCTWSVCFREGLLVGRLHTLSSPSLFSWTQIDKYIFVESAEGKWKDDKRHGNGKLTYVNGLSYEVTF
jgi:hypothetical protein